MPRSIQERARLTAFCLVAIVTFSAASRAADVALPSAHVPAAVERLAAPLFGSPPPAQIIALSVALKLGDEAGLDRLLASIYDPASPRYHQYVSVAEFTTRFGPSQADYDATLHYLRASGLQVTAVSANRYLIGVAGSVADVERAFHVRLGLYRHPTESRLFMAPDREPTLDESLPVSHVTGLDDYRIATPRLSRAGAVRPRASGSGPNQAFTGRDVRLAYYGSGTRTGSGQSLGLMELAGFNIADVQQYFSSLGQTLAVPVIGVSTDGMSLACGALCDDGEQALDIEYAISMAPGMAQVQVYVGYNAEDVLNRMASDNTSKQLSTSWGWAENFATDDPLFKEMAAQGQSFLTASGDYSSLQASGPWPEEDANLTAVGGTDLFTAGAGGSWRLENGWSGSAGGPSLDLKIKTPAYQKPYVGDLDRASSTLRNVPDVAADGNQNNYICANGACDGGWGGTSFASPIWAGYVALINEQAAARGLPPVGFLNPALYAWGHSSRFHDIRQGQSGRYSCLPSYDLVTGLGSPRGAGLVDALTER